MNGPFFTSIGGPTALLEFAGLRLLTDPSSDPPGEEYRLPQYTLRKLAAPALAPDALPALDAVLLSHDHHFDNLDRSGRRLLASVPRVFTTQVGAAHLTFTAAEALEAARAFGDAAAVPLHYEGWDHFSEGRAQVEKAFASAGMRRRLRWPLPGVRDGLEPARSARSA